MTFAKVAAAALVSVLASSCANPDARFTPVDDEQGLTQMRAKLAALRERLVPKRDAGYRVSSVLHEGRSGRTISSRGALAVHPPDAVRLQLVGPAGALALDVWISGDRARLAIPPIDRVERIRGDAPQAGRPIAFLRWWMLHPLDGELVRAFHDDRGGARYVVRADDGAEIDARVDVTEHDFEMTRTSARDVEKLEAHGPPCGTARYESHAAHLVVEVSCEGETPSPPNPRAFEDPDHAP